jgi:lipopolysaccharide transport system permease protein
MVVRVPHRITPEAPTILSQTREVLRAGDLFRLLFTREVNVRYKQTALGMAWVVLQPLLPALIFAAVFGAFARLPSGGTPYFLFALSGLVIFGLFSNSASRAGTAFLRDGQLVSKVYFPRALLPLATGSAAIVDFAVGVALLLVLDLATGAPLTGAVFAVPVIALAALILGLAVGLAISALSAHYRDFAIAIPFALQVLLYASPVVYSSELVPDNLRVLFAINPMVGVTEAFRFVLLGTPSPTAADVGLAAVVGLGIVLLSIVVFHRASRDLPDIL